MPSAQAVVLARDAAWRSSTPLSHVRLPSCRIERAIHTAAGKGAGRLTKRDGSRGLADDAVADFVAATVDGLPLRPRAGLHGRRRGSSAGRHLVGVDPVLPYQPMRPDGRASGWRRPSTGRRRRADGGRERTTREGGESGLRPKPDPAPSQAAPPPTTACCDANDRRRDETTAEVCEGRPSSLWGGRGKGPSRCCFGRNTDDCRCRACTGRGCGAVCGRAWSRPQGGGAISGRPAPLFATRASSTASDASGVALVRW